MYILHLALVLQFSMKNIRKNFVFSRETAARLAVTAAIFGKSQNALIDYAVEQLIENQPPAKKKAIKDGIKAALED